METITLKQYESLIQKIYDTLMAMPDMGMGEMGESKDEATRIVDEWMEENSITLNEEEPKTSN